MIPFPGFIGVNRSFVPGVSAALPVNVTPSTVSGVGYQGQIISATPGAWDNVDGFALGFAAFSGASLDIGPQAADCTGFDFSVSGDKLFVVSRTTDTVYEYNLSSAFDIQTAVYSGNSLDISTESSLPTCLFISSSGDRMFVNNQTGSVIYQYNFSVPFDLSTATYSGNSFSVSAQEGSLQDIFFNSFGTKLFIVGTSSDSVYEYNLSVAFDITTASYSGNSFGLFPTSSSPTGLAFSDSGNKMFILDSLSDSVFEYILSTPFDITTASYTGNSFSISGQETIPQSVRFNDNGYKMYVAGFSSDSVHAYSLGVFGQWLADSVPIAGATALSYEVSAENSGKEFVYRETGQNAFGSTIQDSSNSVHNFVPTDIVNTEIWVDAADEGTITVVSGRASQWDDKSGNANNFVQTVASLRPITGSTTVNGFNVIDGDGIDDVMVSPFNVPADQNFNVLFFGSTNNTSSADCLFDFVNPAPDNRLTNVTTAVLARLNGVSLFESIPTSVVGQNIVYANFDNSTAVFDLYVNGSTSSFTSYPVALSGATLPFYSPGDTFTECYIFDDSSGGNAWAEWLGEYVVVPGTLSLSDRQKIEGYYAHKWAQLALLPGGHPYKTSPPLP